MNLGLPRLRYAFAIGFTLALALACIATNANAACSQTEVTRTSTALETARQTLLALPIGDGTDTNVPRSAQTAITAMKDALDHFVVAYMQCFPSGKPDPAKLQTEISAKAHATTAPSTNPAPDKPAPDKPAPDKPADAPANPNNTADAPPAPNPAAAAAAPNANVGKYGRDLAFEIKTSGDARRLIGIQAKFSIECGADSEFWIFAPEGRSWREVIRWQGVPYNTLAGAYDAFDYAISPPDDTGNWFVITKNVMPWCSSTWSEIRYALLRPNDASPHPKALLARKDSIFWGGDDLGSVHAEKDSFEVRFHSNSIDTSIHNRLYIMHYQIDNDALSRTQPVAANPRDFVDEWLRVPWLEAQQWSDKTVITSLHNAHSDVERLEKDGGLTFESVYRCGAAQEDYEVTLAAGTAKKFYFRVVNSPDIAGGFILHATSNSQTPACKGDNLLDSMQSK